MSYCQKCGSKVEGNFCSNCGTALGTSGMDTDNINYSSRRTSLGIENVEIFKFGLHAICWISLAILLLLIVFVPCYEYEYEYNYWETYDGEWTMLGWNKMLFTDLKEEIDIGEETMENFEENRNKYTSSQIKNYEEKGEILSKIKTIWFANVLLCLVIVGTLSYAIYIYATKTEDYERATFVQAGEIASITIAIGVIVNYLFLNSIKNIGEEMYGDAFTMEAKGGELVILIIAIVNAKVVLGLFNNILFKLTNKDDDSEEYSKLRKVASMNVEENKTSREVKNAWTCSVCGCVNADYVGSCKCGQSRHV